MRIHHSFVCIVALYFINAIVVNSTPVSTNLFACNESTTLYINATHPNLFIKPTSKLYPQMLCSWKIFFNPSLHIDPSSIQAVYMKLEVDWQNIVEMPAPHPLKIWNCRPDGRGLIAYDKQIFDGYTQENQICILYNSDTILDIDNWMWGLNLSITYIDRYNPQYNHTYPISNNELIVTKEHPLKTITGFPLNTAITVHAAQGNLEVYVLFEIIPTDMNIYEGMFYLYDSSFLTNFDTAIYLDQSENYIKVATNKSFTILYICDSDQCGVTNFTQIVYRIVEYHSANCDITVGENLVYAPSSERITKTLSALQTGSCIFSLMVPYMATLVHTNFAILNIGLINYQGDGNVKVVLGYNDTYVLFEFNEGDAPLWQDITLYGSIISFIIPPGGVLNLCEFQSQYHLQQINFYFNESSFGIVMSPSYPDGLFYEDYMYTEINLICNLGASNYNVTIVYADIPLDTKLQVSGNNNQDIFTNKTIHKPKFLTYASTTDVRITFSIGMDEINAWGGFLIRYEAAYIEENAPSKFRIWIIYAGVGVFTVILIIVILFCIYRQKRSKKRFEQMYDLLKYMNVSKENIEEMQRKSDEFLIQPTNLHIYFDRQIGQGSTSSVYKGHIVGPAPLHVSTKTMETQLFTDCDVAVKLSSNFGPNEVENLFQEINAMRKIGSHKNVVSFLGWCMYQEAPCLAFELAEQDLLTYVQSFREKVEEVSQRVFLSILWQITQGMQYIASRGLIHRDLAARNILLCDNNVVKISDFGLCCNPGQTLIYQASLPKRLPMKWLPVEALTNRIFSEKSDVWAFGILIYEAYSLGKTPYENMDNTEVREFLQTGRRLEKPDLATEDLYNLMKSCWEEEPLNRPAFSELSDNLRKMLEDLTDHYEYLLV